MDEGKKTFTGTCFMHTSFLSYAIDTVALYTVIGCFKQCSEKDCPRQIIYFLLPFLTPPSFVNKAVYPGLL